MKLSNGLPVDVLEARRYFFAGKSIFTLSVGEKRYSYRIRVKSHKIEARRAMHFVDLLTGPDNDEHWKFFSFFTATRSYGHSRKSKIGKDAPGPALFRRVAEALIARTDLPDDIVLHKALNCARCGRLLTDPESIERGYGPHCATMVNLDI